MPSLANFSTAKPVKVLYLGDPGSGKTGSLAALVAANFKLRIWDFDNLLEPLFQYTRRNSSDKLANVSYQTFTDKIKAPDSLTFRIGGDMRVASFADGQPTAFIKGLKQFDHWKTPEEDLGSPKGWGHDTFVIVDSLTTMSAAAFRYCQAMNPAAKDGRTHYGTAQQLIINVLAELFAEQFNVNVLVLAHLEYDKNHLQITKGFPRSMGSALQTQIGAYFNCILMAESLNDKRVIRTKSTGIVDLKNPMSFDIPDNLPLETGLATFMEKLRAKEQK